MNEKRFAYQLESMGGLLRSSVQFSDKFPGYTVNQHVSYKYKGYPWNPSEPTEMMTTKVVSFYYQGKKEEGPDGLPIYIYELVDS